METARCDGEGKSLYERDKRLSYLELGMRGSGRPVLENYGSTKRGKEKVVPAKKPGRGGPGPDLDLP